MSQSGLLGSRIGHIRIVDVAGKGGMGFVYVGFDEKLERRVAVKAIRESERLDADVRIRFLREARVLSQLDHRGICKIHDYVESEGKDYLILELIIGKSLTEAIPELRSDAVRADIAAQIADVLVAAHSKGVIHRDVKPSNVMMTPEGHVKILDFGLSRRLESEAETLVRGEEGSLESAADGSDYALTRMGSVVGTLAYMSPEQARGEPLTTASDIYSFGLLLQELFTKKPPFVECPDKESLWTRARAGESEPVTGIDPDWTGLINRLKSLAPAARPTAVDIVERIRWIRERPKRRLKRLALTGAVGTLALLAGALGFLAYRVSREAGRANREAEVARQVSAFLEGLFKVSNPSEARGNSVTAREILDRGAEKASRELGSQPVVQARLLSTMGRVYYSLGLYDQALSLDEKALELRRGHLGEKHLDVAASLVDLGTVHWKKGEYEKAREHFELALALREELLGPEALPVADSLHNLGNLKWSRGDYDAARGDLERALSIREKTAPDSADVASTLNSLGAIAYTKGDYGEARRLWERTLAIREKTLGPDHPLVGQTLNNLGTLLTSSGDPAGARPLLERTVRIQEKVLGPNHPDLASGLMNLGDCVSSLGDLAGARLLFERAVRILEAASPGNPELARFLDRLAWVDFKDGRVGEAMQLYERSLSLRQSRLGPKHHEIADSLAGLARCASREGRFRDAEALCERALALSTLPDGGVYPGTEDILEIYAAALRAKGDKARAGEMEALLASLKKKKS